MGKEKVLNKLMQDKYEKKIKSVYKDRSSGDVSFLLRN